MELETGVSVSVSGYTLIIPAVSVGNVGQLAVDVLLATLQPTLASQVHHPCLIPLVASDPICETSDQLTTAMQLYTDSHMKLAILQIRSGLLPGSGSEFITDLLSWCQNMDIEKIICMTSSHNHERLDSQLTGVPLRYVTTSQLTTTSPLVRLEERETDQFYIPGGGLARRLMIACQEKGMSSVALLKFCSEGDNSQDGLMLADYLYQFMSWTGETKYKVPPSWQHLFGPPAPVEMFW